ncbi:MAG TPA: Mth938-like domain-containing protein [Burkholderiales bacterium]|nr:Mth938-like domain-containing protein [Burkholderiales bacterium]
MKLHPTPAAGRNAFTGYGEGYVLVNGERYQASVLVQPEGPVRPWDVARPADLDLGRMEWLATLDVEVLLLGTGGRLAFPPPALLLPLAHARIGVEVMDTPAACRTYNILMGEGRRVAAALILGGPPPRPGPGN